MTAAFDAVTIYGAVLANDFPVIRYTDASPEVLRLCAEVLRAAEVRTSAKARLDKALVSVPEWAHPIDSQMTNFSRPAWEARVLRRLGIPKKLGDRPKLDDIRALNSRDARLAGEGSRAELEATTAIGAEREATYWARVQEARRLCDAAGLAEAEVQRRAAVKLMEGALTRLADIPPANLADVLLILQAWKLCFGEIERTAPTPRVRLVDNAVGTLLAMTDMGHADASSAGRVHYGA